MSDQQHGGRGVERDLAGLMGLGVLLLKAVGTKDDPPGDREPQSPADPARCRSAPTHTSDESDRVIAVRSYSAQGSLASVTN